MISTRKSRPRLEIVYFVRDTTLAKEEVSEKTPYEFSPSLFRVGQGEKNIELEFEPDI